MIGRAMVIVAAALLATPALGAAPSGEQKAEFHRICMGIASNEPLCTCKADAAVELIDSEFMAIVISAMQGEAYPSSAQSAYDDYIRRSNAVCIPGY